MAKPLTKPLKKTAHRPKSTPAERKRQATKKAPPITRHASPQKARQAHPQPAKQARRPAMNATNDKQENKGSAYNANSETENRAATGRATGDTGTRNVQKAQQRRQERDTSPRGAGSGEEAVRLRQLPPREAVPPVVESTEYPKGEIDKGRIDVEAQAEGFVADVIAARDRRAYLIDQAEKNEAANDELNAIQVEQNRQLQFAQSQLQDPDVMRENSMESALADLEAHSNERDPATVQAQKEFREQQFSGKSATTADHAPGNNRIVQGTPAEEPQVEP